MNEMNDNEILLSVCIPTSDRLDSAKENAIRCLSYDLEWLNVVITVDDVTNDGVAELTELRDKRFKCCVNEWQLGYANLAESLYNGDGKYCLLLSDVDSIFDVDWEIVKKQLEDNNDIGVYICDYYDSNGDILANCRDGFIEKGSTNALNFAIRCTSWSGGIIFRREALHHVWDEIDKNTIIWYFYSQSVSALHIVKNENCARLRGMNILRGKKRKRSKRVFECDKNNRPYWEIGSRNNQIMRWINEISLIDRDVNCVSDVLCRSIFMRNYDFLIKYFKYIHFEYSEYTSEYVRSNTEHFSIHLSMRLTEWISMADDIEENIRNNIIKIFGYLPNQCEEYSTKYKNKTVEELKTLFALCELRRCRETL